MNQNPESRGIECIRVRLPIAAMSISMRAKYARMRERNRRMMQGIRLMWARRPPRLKNVPVMEVWMQSAGKSRDRVGIEAKSRQKAPTIWSGLS